MTDDERDEVEEELIRLAEEIVWQQWRIERILQAVDWPYRWDPRPG